MGQGSVSLIEDIPGSLQKREWAKIHVLNHCQISPVHSLILLLQEVHLDS